MPRCRVTRYDERDTRFISDMPPRPRVDRHALTPAAAALPATVLLRHCRCLRVMAAFDTLRFIRMPDVTPCYAAMITLPP